MLTRLFELRNEARIFLSDSNFPLSDRLSDFEWLAKLSYLSDIFNHLNGVNLSLQGKSVTAFQVQNKIEATIEKLDIWAGRIRKSNSESFENLSHLLTEEAMSLPTLVKKLIEEHLQGLKSQFCQFCKFSTFSTFHLQMLRLPGWKILLQTCVREPSQV